MPPSVQCMKSTLCNNIYDPPFYTAQESWLFLNQSFSLYFIIHSHNCMLCDQGGQYSSTGGYLPLLACSHRLAVVASCWLGFVQGLPECPGLSSVPHFTILEASLQTFLHSRTVSTLFSYAECKVRTCHVTKPSIPIAFIYCLLCPLLYIVEPAL